MVLITHHFYTLNNCFDEKLIKKGPNCEPFLYYNQFMGITKPQVVKQNEELFEVINYEDKTPNISSLLVGLTTRKD
jgi:hypothetical protein